MSSIKNISYFKSRKIVKQKLKKVIRCWFIYVGLMYNDILILYSVSLLNTFEEKLSLIDIVLLHEFCLLSKSESVKFSLIESVICLFTDSSVKKYFSLLNQLIFTDESVKQIFFTVKSVNFHWNNQWNLTDLQ